MTIRWMDGHEAVDRLNPVIAMRNSEEPQSPPWLPLNSATSFAVAAMEDEFVLGFIALQLAPFLGPLWVLPIERNGEISRRLVDDMVNVMSDMKARGVVVVCENPATERMCKSRGMRRIEHPVYVAQMEA